MQELNESGDFTLHVSKFLLSFYFMLRQAH